LDSGSDPVKSCGPDPSLSTSGGPNMHGPPLFTVVLL